MARKVGDGLYVNVNVQITDAVNNLAKLREAARQTANEINNIGKGGGSATEQLKKQSAAGAQAGESTKKYGEEADKAATKTRRLGQAANQTQAAMYRFSQAFVNMRYGNPLGTVVGLSQGMGALGKAAGTATSGTGLLTKGLVGVTGVAIAAAIGVGGVAAAAYKLGAAGVSAASDLNRLRISYTALIGDAQAADREVAFMQGMATQSIVPTENLMEANRLLLAYGVKQTKVRHEMVQFFSDFAAATNLPVSRLNDMAYAIGQVNSQGKANQIDMRQLANAGLDLSAVYGEIARQQGITISEASKWTSEGKITAQVLYPAILKVGEAYEAAGVAARNSFSGILANLPDLIQVQMANAFEPLLPMLLPVLRGVEDIFKSLGPMIEGIVAAMQNGIGYITDALGGVEDNELLDVDLWTVLIPEAIHYAFATIGVVIRGLRTLWEAIQIGVNFSASMFWTLAGAVANAFADILSVINGAVQVAANVGVIPQSWADATADAANSVRGFADSAADSAEYARGAIAASARQIEAIWSKPVSKTLTYQIIKNENLNYRDAGIRGPDFNNWNFDYAPDLPTSTGGGGGGGGGGSKKDTSKWSALIAWAKKLAAELAKAWDAINAALRRQFGELSQFQKAMTSGSTDSVIGMYNTISDNLNKSYDALIEMARGNKKQIKAIKAEQKREQRYLRKQAAAIIALNRENQKLEKAREKQYEVDKGYLEAEWADRLATQSKAVEEATENYEAANDKLQDLISERNSFVGQLQEGIRNFVNSFTASEETIQKYVRLDGAGSFMQTEERRSKSFKDALKERLNALRNWVSNIEALRGRGLNASLLQQIVAGGPEATADLANELATASDSSLAEINAAQEELASQMQAMGDYAADAWYNQDISQQSEVVAGLKSVVDAAQATYDELETQRDQALADLETSYDKYNDEIGQQIKANEAKIAQMTNKMQERLKALGKEFKKSGLLAVEGLIEGITEKVKDVEKAAKMIADVLVKAMKKYLGIASPSKVGIYLGSMVAKGVAGGMESGISGVEAAAIKVANASLPMPDSAVGANTNVRVFIGDTELTDIVRTEIDSADASDLSRVIAGRRL